VFSDEMRDLLCVTAEQKSKTFGTGAFSSIIGPTGDYLAGPDTGDEKILYAEIDPEIIIGEKISHDLTGHYNRFDLFTLVVDDRPVEHGAVFKAPREIDVSPSTVAKDSSMDVSEGPKGLKLKSARRAGQKR
jgi:aliphatic nitrilase